MSQFLHLGCYQADEIRINKMYLCNASEEAFRCIYTLFNAAQKDKNANLQLQMHK